MTETHHDTAAGHGQPRDPSGFSMIEVLVAALILVVIALGLVPLYSRAIRSNVEGFDYTQVSNSAKSRAEEFLQYAFNGEPLTLEDGKTEREYLDYYSAAQHEWVDTAPTDGSLFTRTTTIRQFSVRDTNTPIPGGTTFSDAVHLKEITVEVEGTRAAESVLGPGKTIMVRVFKAQ